MAGNSLLSSPSDNMIDPAILNAGQENSVGKGQKKSVVQKNATNVKPSASRLNQQSPPKNNNQSISGITGWTPLVSRTVFNDQLLSYNLTPSSKFLNGMLGLGAEIDYSQGLNLTPFLTHNLSIGNPASATSNGLNNITPFHDKSSHLADFFMDSPIRQTPIKDVDTITPSKFKIGSESKKLKYLTKNEFGSAVKRSITQVDTPPRQQNKVSISSVAEKRSQKHEEKLKNSKDNTSEEGGSDNEGDDEEENEKDKENRDDENRTKNSRYKDTQDGKYTSALRTPCKPVLKESTNTILNKESKSTPKTLKPPNKSQFQTPAGAHAVSSPSTVIMSSTAKSPAKDLDPLDDNEHGTEIPYGRRTDGFPPTPTPKKDLDANVDERLKPAMGIFSEKKTNPGKLKASFKINGSGSGNSNTSSSNNGPKSKGGNKAQMRAGMNKFQIVFTDVHTLMNNKGKHKKTSNPNSKSKRSQLGGEPQSSDSKYNALTRVALNNDQNLQHGVKAPSSEEHNSSLGLGSKEVSLISMNSSSLNTSHLNMSSTDHSSFDLGGLSSTPNGKYFLDRLFEKPSPQMPSQGHQGHPMFSNMPPPVSNASRLQNGVTQQPPHSMMMMMMMMSTPQHQNIVQYGNNGGGYNGPGDISPTSESQASNQYLSAFSYQNMHSYPKDESPIEGLHPGISGNGMMHPATPHDFNDLGQTGKTKSYIMVSTTARISTPTFN